jgi:hypothetical protein
MGGFCEHKVDSSGSEQGPVAVRELGNEPVSFMKVVDFLIS